MNHLYTLMPLIPLAVSTVACAHPETTSALYCTIDLACSDIRVLTDEPALPVHGENSFIRVPGPNPERGQLIRIRPSRSGHVTLRDPLQMARRARLAVPLDLTDVLFAGVEPEHLNRRGAGVIELHYWLEHEGGIAIETAILRSTNGRVRAWELVEFDRGPSFPHVSHALPCSHGVLLVGEGREEVVELTLHSLDGDDLGFFLAEGLHARRAKSSRARHRLDLVEDRERCGADLRLPWRPRSSR